MEETWESLFINKAKEQGHSDEYCKACIEYATALHQKNLPVLFNKDHLAMYMRLSIKRQQMIVSTHQDCYDVFYIKKRHSKRKRKICAPKGDLIRAQDIIYRSILLKDNRISEAAHGFIPKNNTDIRNIYTNAKPHANCKWLVNVDLKDFFPSVRYDMVLSYFKSLGYVEEVCVYLTELCTYHMELPQGAPTSPMLSNIVAFEMDKELQKLALSKQSVYTRYADDLTFSGMNQDNMVSVDEIINVVSRFRFRINKNKTKKKKQGQRQMVTGLTVSNGVHVPKKYRKDVWMELHSCHKFGVANHIQHLNNGKKFYKQWLLGRIMYIRSIDKDCGDKMLESYNKLNWL